MQAGGGGGGGILHNLLYSGHRRQTSLGSGNNGGGGGMDAGEAMRKSQMKRYAYEGCSIWFAEMATTRHGRSGTGGGAEGLSKIHGAGDGRGYDATANSLSLERSIQALEAAGLTGVPRYSVEETWSCFLHALFTARDIDALLKCMPGERSGGSWIGGEAVGRFLPTNIVGKGKMFWEEVVLNGMPQSLKTKTVNRTVGARQVVEELELVFWDDGGAGEGRGEMGWLIGVGEGGRVLKTRGKKVKEVIVLSGKVRAGKVVEVKGYWDRESVLRQVEGDGEGDGETLVGN